VRRQSPVALPERNGTGGGEPRVRFPVCRGSQFVHSHTLAHRPGRQSSRWAILRQFVLGEDELLLGRQPSRPSAAPARASSPASWREETQARHAAGLARRRGRAALAPGRQLSRPQLPPGHPRPPRQARHAAGLGSHTRKLTAHVLRPMRHGARRRRQLLQQLRRSRGASCRTGAGCCRWWRRQPRKRRSRPHAGQPAA